MFLRSLPSLARAAVCAAFLLVAVGCSDPAPDANNPAGTGGSTDQDSGGKLTFDTVVGGETDTGGPSDPDATTEDTADGSSEPEDIGLPKGTFGAPCETNTDCDSGWCVPSAQGLVCSQTCVDSCPDGFKCVPKQSAGGDVNYLCVPGNSSLCDPCHLSADCNDASETANVCLEFGNEGKFCGVSCASSGKCPSGYSCDTMVDPESGKATKQCVPVTGKCTCSPKAVAESKSTTCANKNFYGTCKGSRQCTSGGLSDCKAPIPAPEECNGLDDDCNGATDDLLSSAKCKVTNEFGTCEGKVVECVGGKPICTAKEAKPEACNGVDDDCDGQTDEELCEDGNVCTKGSCNSDGSCKQAPQSGAECDDGNSCTNQDKCSQGTCTGSKILDCDDADPCTLDGCDPLGGCTHTPQTGPCPDDGNACTQDVCTAGKCTHPATAEGGGCLEDGNSCTLDVCKSGTCQHLPDADGKACLEDGDPCTQDVCTTGACKHPPIKDNTACADDGNPCTSDVCQSGKCSHPPVSFTLPCADDANPCTADVCDKGGCSHQPLGSDKGCLDDGDPCTQDACILGKCSHPPASNNAPCLDDGLLCTDDVCNSGKCSHPPLNGKPCAEDGNPCTQDVCGSGTCSHPPNSGNVPCADDGVECTKDVCQNGLCKHVPANNPCNDNDPCTLTDTCDSATGKCKGFGKPNCDDNNPCTTDSCNPGEGCIHKNVDVFCNDGNSCTTGDQCVSGKCVGTGNKSCDDGNPCTNDNCEGGCTHVNNSSACADDGNPCTKDVCSNGSCGHPPIANGQPCDNKDGNPCADGVCQSGFCKSQYNDSVCNDNNACTSNDKCVNGSCQGTSFKNCDDGNPCTDDACDKYGSCTHKAVDGSSCAAPSGECPIGVCTGGQCLSKPGVTCQAKQKTDLCGSVQVPGTCSGSGKCVANQGAPGFTCPGCNGICIKCTIFGGLQFTYCLAF